MADIHKEAFVAGNHAMFSSAKYSDLTIRCGFDEYKVHRVIICARSDFFAKACDGEFLEAKNATIDLDNDDPQTVKRMLSYLYTLEYDDGQRQSEEEIKGTQQQRQEASSDAILPLVSQSLSASVEEASSPETASPTASSPLLQASSKDISPAEARHAPHERLMNNVLVYALADKYDIPELKTLAKAKFSTLVGSSLEDLSTTANAVFTTTPASDLGLRDIVINVCSESVQAALDNESIVSTMEEQGSFALGVLRHIVGRLASVEARLGETLIREDVLRADLANSEKDKKGLAKQAENALREEEEWWLSRLDSVLNSAGAVEKCRHCRIGFFGHLKRIENSATPAFQVTCAKCGTGGTKYSL